MWSANQWSILGIEATTDISKIKAAYAKKAKLVHPEEHPEEFQELQKAYKSAVKYAKLQNTYKNTVENNKTSNETYVSKSMSETKTISEEKTISEIKNISKKEIVSDKKIISKIENVSEKETVPEQEIVLERKDIFKKEKISDKKIIPETEDISWKEKASDKEVKAKNVSWKENISNENTDKINDEQEFIYDEISYEEKSQQCILDTICLAKNIYLINDIRCWEWFFGRQEYKELYENDEFRLNFVETIRRIFGWTRKTLLYIEAFLKQYQKSTSKTVETNTIKWKMLKRPKLFDPMKARQKNVTNEQKKLHDVLLAGVRNNGYSGNMNDFDSFLQYINIYLNYAHNNLGRIEDLYQSGRNSTHSLIYIYAIVIMFIIFILCSMISRTNYQKTEQEKHVEKWNQERLENVKKWQQPSQNLEAIEQKREEMMSRFSDEIDSIIK